MNLPPSPSLLLVDDDAIFCAVLARALSARGYIVHIAHNVAMGEAVARECRPAYAIVDLNLPGASGLHLVKALCRLLPDIKILVLTGYASIATAVEAIKLGATHYLSKPADADEILAALLQGATRQDELARSGIEQAGQNETSRGATEQLQTSSPIPLSRLEWEYIQRVLGDHAGNVSATARALKMHRRTLQRKLAKRPRRE